MMVNKDKCKAAVAFQFQGFTLALSLHSFLQQVAVINLTIDTSQELEEEEKGSSHI